MKIGGREVEAPQGAYGTRSRYEGPTVGPTVDTQGLSALANVMGQAGDVGAQYLKMRVAEDVEREDFATAQAYQKWQGEQARKAVAMQDELGPQGAGYVDMIAQDFDKSFEQFQASIPERLRPEYGVKGQSFKQDSLIRADGFTRTATRGYSLFTVEEQAKTAEVNVYENPEDTAAIEALEETIRTAPGLSAAERESQLASVRRRTGQARITGVIRDGRSAGFMVPHTSDVQTRLVPAVMGVESAGDPDAESNKGASGLMQVMPGTGKMISVALRDKNFPYNGTVAEQKAYLKDPNVSKVYGTYELNNLLTQFGGDVELALIGYNAGPGVAQRYAASGRNKSVLPAETQAYVPKVMARMGALSPDMALDPQYGLDLSGVLAAQGAIESTLGASQNLAADILAKAEADAVKIHSANMKIAQEQQETGIQNLYQQAEMGQAFEPAYWDAVQKGELVYKQEDMNRGRAISERVLKTERDTAAAISLAQTGGVLTEAQGDLLLGPAIREGVLNKDPEVTGVALNNISTIGFMPPAIQQVVRQMLFSNNLDDMNSASQMIMELEARNPAIVAKLPEDMLVRANSFEALRLNGMPDNELQEHMSVVGTAAGQKAFHAAKQTDDYKDNATITPEDFARTFDTVANRLPGVERARPSSGAKDLVLQQILYSETYDAFYAATLNGERAKELTLEQVAKTFGPTQVNGSNEVMWLPPEQVLSNLRFDVNGDGALETVQLPPAFIEKTFDRDLRAVLGLPPGQRYIIHATRETKSAAETGQSIPYVVVPVNEDGWPQPSQLYKFNYNRVAQDLLLRREERETLQRQFDLETDPTALGRLDLQIQELNGIIP